MNQDQVRLLLAGFISLTAPVVIARTTTEAHRSDLGLVLQPFGFARIVIAHSIASLPLALLLGRKVSARLAAPWAGPGKAALCVASIFVALLLMAVFREGSELLAGAGSHLKVVMRSLWCLALQLPCCLALVPAGKKSGDYQPACLDLILAAAVAVLLPGAYAAQVIVAQSASFADNLERGRLLRARAALEGILDLAGTEPILNRSPADWRNVLEQELAGALGALRVPLPKNAPSDLRLRRAMLLGMVDRLDEAEQELQGLAAEMPSAKLLLAVVLQWRARWVESSALYREILERQLPAAWQNAQSLGDCIAAYDGLAFNARERKEYPLAEAAYREALSRLPPAVAAHFHFRLGQHYHQAGRPAAALEHLKAAANLRPDNYAERIGPLVEQIRRFTPACFLGLDRPSR
jgi:tetratricopeptide (TPR) repeat protein